MTKAEQDVQRSLVDLMLKLHKDEQKENISVQKAFLHVILPTLTKLGGYLSSLRLEEGAEETWQEYQDVIEIVKTGYSCKSLGWSKLLPSLIILYLENHETFRMFDTKICETSAIVLKEQLRKKYDD